MSSDSSFPRPPSPPREQARVVDLDGARDVADAAQSTERPLTPRKGAQVVAFPGQQQRTHKRRRPEVAREAEPSQAPSPKTREPSEADAPKARESSASQRTEARVAEAATERPRYLASELLKQDWYPRAPLARSLRWGAIGIGGCGAAAVLSLGAGSGGALALATLLALSAVAGAVPLSARVRGAVLGLLGVLGTALAGWLRMGDGEPAAPLLVACVTLSASALFFRAAHRTARFARVLVGVGLTATAGWLALTGGLDALVVDSLAWQDWIEPALRVALALVVVSTLLTFLDPTGHGGAWVAGGAFLVWLALETIASLTVAAWPAAGPSELALDHPSTLATLAFPLLAALAAGGLCQVWVLVARSRSGRREAPSRVTWA